MEKLDQIDGPPHEEDGDYPQCPHGPWPCPYKQLWPMFQEYGDDYVGHLPVCNLCVQWSQVKQLIKIADALKLLRYSG
ncbi:unnamed protein product [marine sediment metagenome]|uniref:Uncharacterized protein n=1 Tax=marine sediment metagenome TaxID=412755 RepID=X1DJ60_9ZZZZ